MTPELRWKRVDHTIYEAHLRFGLFARVRDQGDSGWGLCRWELTIDGVAPSDPYLECSFPTDGDARTAASIFLLGGDPKAHEVVEFRTEAGQKSWSCSCGVECTTPVSGGTRAARRQAREHIRSAHAETIASLKLDRVVSARAHASGRSRPSALADGGES